MGRVKAPSEARVDLAKTIETIEFLCVTLGSPLLRNARPLRVTAISQPHQGVIHDDRHARAQLGQALLDVFNARDLSIWQRRLADNFSASYPAQSMPRLERPSESAAKPFGRLAS